MLCGKNRKRELTPERHPKQKIPKMDKNLQLDLEQQPKTARIKGTNSDFASDLHGTVECTVSPAGDSADVVVEEVSDDIPHDGEFNNTDETDETAEEIDVSSRVKSEEMNLGRNILRRQIFIPEVLDISWAVLDDRIRISCASKCKKFNKEFGSRSSEEHFRFDVLTDTTQIDASSIVVHRVSRKSFELEFRYRAGCIPVPPPPPPAPKNQPIAKSSPKATSKVDRPIGKVAPFTKEAGYTGLVNLGNTCFMASVLQCLANVPTLRDFFLSEAYRNDINEDNPLGTGGKIANSFYYLLTQLWSGKHQSVKPSRIKDVVSERAQQFQGYSQHDAQEFCTFILDLLHEDVNLVKKKPYVEAKDADGRPDQVVADESWDMFKARNKSKIVDLFYGQYKSKLVCPKCQRDSITFDPFVYLSVPLPRAECEHPGHCVSRQDGQLFVPADQEAQLG
jgi:hypothetical protein